jgi:nitrogen regulatory protein P-II 1
MKHLTLIIHTNVQQDLADQLRGMEQVSGFTFCHVEGHGVQVESDPFLSARDKVVGYTPRIRVDILLKGSDVDSVLESLRSTTNGIQGEGIYWVTAVEQSGRL